VADASSSPADSASQARAPSGSPAVTKVSTADRSAEISSDSSGVRAGASPVGVGHPDAPGPDLADLPGVRAEQEDVARHRLGRPVFVDGADEEVVGLEHDPEIADLGDGPARRQRRQPGRRPGPHLAVDGVEMEIGRPPPSTGRDALADHGQDLVEGAPGKIAVGVRPADHVEEVVDPQAPRCRYRVVAVGGRRRRAR
jgi:hypothetical protein